jgi:hypothetical protein
LIAPTKGCPGVIATDWASGFGKNVIDAQDWAHARDQINAYAASAQPNPVRKGP